MQSYGRNSDLARHRFTSGRVSGEAKQVRKVHTKKIPYRVGYNWNKGGRVKELRIRHLARKFLKIWIQNTFGRVLPHDAKSHYNKVVLRRTFEGWRDEWWTSRREWTLTMRAECHYRYHLYNWTLNSWRKFMYLNREMKTQVEKAQLFADRQWMSLVWDRWEVFIDMRRIKNQMLQSALEQSRHSAMRSAWCLWQTRLQQHREFRTLEDQAQKQRARTLQRRALLQWKEMCTTASCQKEKESKAALHFIFRLKRRTLHQWIKYVSCRQTKKETQAMAKHACCLHLMTRKYWKMWKNRVEEAEDLSFKPLTKKIQSNYSISLLRSCFHLWREKLAERRHSLELEHRADLWFIDRMLPRCFQSWVELTLQSRLHEQRRQKAEAYNRQRQYTWVFYTWWGRSEKHKEEMLSERMAILRDERCNMQKTWTQWRQRTQQKIKEMEKEEASHHLYLHKLLHKTMIQWKKSSSEIQDRRNREQQACHQGDLRCMRLAVEKWKKFVQSQRVKKSNLKEIQRYHEVKLLKRSFEAWKKHYLQMSQIYNYAVELHRQHTQCFLRKVLIVWREYTAQQAEVQLAEQQAQIHFHHSLQLKVFHAWRGATICAVSKRLQQGEALSRVQWSVNEVRLLQSFRRWRNQTSEARRERISMERARGHHNFKLLSKALKMWNEHHYQHRKNKVMKRQGLLLLRLKMYQMYFEQWKIKLQYRQREAKQVERALWHWSLTLQAKVLYGWRLWVTEQRRKQEHAARAAVVYRDQLLREGVTCILTYAAHMNDLTTSLTQHSQHQRSQHLQRVVKRCAMRWKQRVLCKPQRQQEVREKPPKKSVSFSLPARCSVSSSHSKKQEADGGLLSKLIQKQCDITSTKVAPNSYQSTIMSTVPPSEPLMSSLDSPQDMQSQELLPPSAFMTTGLQNKLEKSSNSDPEEAPVLPFPQFVTSFEHHSITYPEKACSGETKVPHFEDDTTDPASALTRDLLRIQQEMKSFQLDRKQLRAWRKLKGILQSWLQTSGKEEAMEKNDVCQELKELEEHIDRLSTELEKRKPMMLLHAERIQHLQTVLRNLGVYSPCQKTEESETQNSVVPM